MDMVSCDYNFWGLAGATIVIIVIDYIIIYRLKKANRELKK